MQLLPQYRMRYQEIAKVHFLVPWIIWHPGKFCILRYLVSPQEKRNQDIWHSHTKYPKVFGTPTTRYPRIYCSTMQNLLGKVVSPLLCKVVYIATQKIYQQQTDILVSIKVLSKHSLSHTLDIVLQYINRGKSFRKRTQNSKVILLVTSTFFILI